MPNACIPEAPRTGISDTPARQAPTERTKPRMTIEPLMTAVAGLAVLAIIAVIVGTLTLGTVGALLFLAGLITGWLTAP